MSIETLLTDAIHAVNAIHGIDDLDALNEQTPLFEKLDSLGVLDLLLELEDALHKYYGVYIQLANEETMNPDSSPFREFGILQHYLEKKVLDAAPTL